MCVYESARQDEARVRKENGQRDERRRFLFLFSKIFFFGDSGKGVRLLDLCTQATSISLFCSIVLPVWLVELTVGTYGLRCGGGGGNSVRGVFIWSMAAAFVGGCLICSKYSIFIVILHVLVFLSITRKKDRVVLWAGELELHKRERGTEMP